MVSCATHGWLSKNLSFWQKTKKLDLLAKIADPDSAPSGSNG
jgi:hypothetical protein